MLSARNSAAEPASTAAIAQSGTDRPKNSSRIEYAVSSSTAASGGSARLSSAPRMKQLRYSPALYVPGTHRIRRCTASGNIELGR